jgi:hypothetical protein
MKRFLKEPLLHFLLIGAAIFVAYSFMSKRSTMEPGKIVITQGQIESLVTGFARTWQRPPAADELSSLIRDRVRDEVYCREAIALGLDKDDTIIRRRLRQKMEFVSDDIAAQTEPTDADLNNYLQAHSDRFRVEQRFTFRQVCLDPQKHGANLSHDVAQLLAKLNQAGDNADVSKLGDSMMLEPLLVSVPSGEIAKQFGESFARKLGELQPRQWQGPIESGYGAHLVFISERTEGRLPALADVRAEVLREWENARRIEMNERFYADLLKRYTVIIEEPRPAEQGTKVATAK